MPEGILGNENGWQRDFNNDAPSLAALRSGNLHGISPFPAEGLVLHPTNSNQSAFKRLPEPMNGQPIFFSFNLKSYSTSGSSQFRFRAADGTVVDVGVVEGSFRVSVNKAIDIGEALEERKDYFIVGRFETSSNGRVVKIAATAFGEKGSIPNQDPDEWDVTAEATLGTEKIWDGINIVVGSSSAAFDDIRIGTTWDSVGMP